MSLGVGICLKVSTPKVVKAYSFLTPPSCEAQVKVPEELRDAGLLQPLSFVYKKEWPIDEVVETTIVSQEEYSSLLPNIIQPNRVYKYKVKVAGVIRHIYFELWPESGAEYVGRWFVDNGARDS